MVIWSADVASPGNWWIEFRYPWGDRMRHWKNQDPDDKV
jgi:hypothetical protein